MQSLDCFDKLRLEAQSLVRNTQGESQHCSLQVLLASVSHLAAVLTSYLH